MDLGALLRYYKREDVQNALVSYAKDREIAISFGEKGYGKRPDVLEFPSDIIEFVKQGATSFHVSEERWNNVHQLNPMLKKNELNELRKGWDLVLDVDCPYWELSKIITWLLIKALKEHKINSVSLKFSGNKGFHIGVPFEAFPGNIEGKSTNELFPDAPRFIATYLLDFIDKKYIEVTSDEKIRFGDRFTISFYKLKEITNKSIDELTKKYCSNCNKIIEKENEFTYEFVCHNCENVIKSAEDMIECPKCKKIMSKTGKTGSLCGCGSNKFYRKFDALSVIDVDTILISSRHLYRMPYSINEKSGLASVIIDPSGILEFEKKYAEVEKLKVNNLKFLDTKNTIIGEAKELIFKAVEFKNAAEKSEEIKKTTDEFEVFQEAAPRELFPPCVENILKGLKDGKKRSLFILVNFLNCCGWSYDKIEELLKEWNKKNEEPLKDVLILGQVRYHKQQKKRILPPNCSNQMYYKDLQLCKPDSICEKIKNPVNYTKRKVFFLKKEITESTGKREKLTEEQKEMRRKYKEMMKSKEKDNV